MARKKKGKPASSRRRSGEFAELLVEGKIDREVYERWNRRAGGKKLPEHVRKKKGKGKKTKRRRSKRRG